jgi:deoxycytidylate deaminase
MEIEVATIQIKIASNEALTSSKKVDSTKEAIASLTPELVVALCGPIGSPIHEASDQISYSLSDFGYKTKQIRLSDLIRLNADIAQVPIDDSSRFNQINTLIKAGDELRRTLGNDVLAKMAIANIGADRKKSYGDPSDRADEVNKPQDKKVESHRICHVIDSIKNIDELKLLRLIYGDALIAIGVFSPLEVRKQNLARPGSLTQTDIEKLIDIDSGEEFSHGQSVRDTFPMCDFFLRVDGAVSGPSEEQSIGQLVSKLRRLFNLIFRTSVISPSSEENAMYAAASAAKNSACLSRQVGAAVTSSSGELLSTGWNDVPRSGGGLYGKSPLVINNDPSKDDERCYALTGTKCHNDAEKRIITEKLIDLLVDNSVLDLSKRSLAIQTISNSRMKDLIEFSRAVHAEMHAILGASRVAGDRILGGKIFVTTYPCHSCARHIVASGISEVYYIEPYRKSLATRLHSDSLSEDVTDNSKKVRLMQFDGVSPRRFIDFFDAGNRKSKAGVLDLPPKNLATPYTNVSMKAIPRLEQVVVAEISKTNLKLPELSDLGEANDPTQTPAA